MPFCCRRCRWCCCPLLPHEIFCNLCRSERIFWNNRTRQSAWTKEHAGCVLDRIRLPLAQERQKFVPLMRPPNQSLACATWLKAFDPVGLISRMPWTHLPSTTTTQLASNGRIT
jgi:hypothetical protein